jgi:tRNA-dihydrouridine synthase 1
MGPGGDPLREYEECQKRVEEIIAEELARNPEEVDSEGRWVGPDREIADGEDVQEGDGFVVEIGGKKFRRTVPWYRCQPYLRPLPEKALEIGAMTAKGEKTQEGGKRNATRKAEDDDVAGPEPKKAKRDAEGDL